MSRLLVLGSRNRKKLGELAELLEPHGLILKTLADFPDSIEVEETGDTFAANARLKATLQARHLKQWVLGEDSGLSVDALGGTRAFIRHASPIRARPTSGTMRCCLKS